jgi:hypothetical protein
MAWSTVGYKQINTQDGRSKVYALTTQADYSINAAAGTATVSGRLLMLCSWPSVPYYGYAHNVIFRINGVDNYNKALNEPNTSGDWVTSYNQTINGKAYNKGCLIGSWSRSVSLTSSSQSIPVYGSYSVSGTANYLPVKGTHVASGSISIPAAGYPSGSISVTSNTRTSATLTGSVSSWGTNSAAGSSVISYGTSTSYGSTATSDTAFTVSPNTTYYYRFRITNAADLVTDYTGNFTTPGNVPSITNTSVGSITRTGGTLSYDVTYDTNASYSSREIQYGLTTSYGTSTTNNVLSSLTPNTLYYYRIRVTDNWSRVSSWSTGTFTTLADSFVRLVYSNGTVTDTKKIYLIDENGVKTEITKQMFHIIT